ncbi:hypothetical protein O6H91_Y029900 [Diphasiastrum complanatum]|nr:hypothetical protein O6H91_Y029900 [Diphasiastrum complanatum]KAJ7300243.1 hypothetical protein O6H91_Y029900 [Diphasiastrum complanatum]KAJ7300246.1 hypothetical protein O6H91_Y029900 [Diphasiastrum complanatum]
MHSRQRNRRTYSAEGVLERAPGPPSGSSHNGVKYPMEVIWDDKEQAYLDVPSSNAGLDNSSLEGAVENLSSSLHQNKALKEASPLGWPSNRHEKLSNSHKLSPTYSKPMWEERRERRETEVSEVELMKERFARLLLGEDMSGGGRGVCTALAISNAITNLSASVFGEIWRLEPLSPERKTMWRREMEWLLSVTDHIVELVPTWQTCPDGSSTEVMVSTSRSDLHINLPALRKLDTMLLDLLDTFSEKEFWYTDRATAASDSDSQENLGSLPRREEKWWLPTPRIPVYGLSDESKRRLQQQRESTSQILKAAMAINAQVLSEMEIPDAYLESLPKNGRTSLGEFVHRSLSGEYFSPDALLQSADLSSELAALELANRIEVAIQVWRRKIIEKQLQPVPKDSRFNTKSTWGGLMTNLVSDENKRGTLVDRAETLLLTLKHRFPGLPQTFLDTSKIQYNKDVGQAILESYSRVLESLAFNVTARIDDVLHADAHKNNSSKNLSPPSPPSDCHSLFLTNDSVPVFDEVPASPRNESILKTPSRGKPPTIPINASVKSKVGEQCSVVASPTVESITENMKFESITKQGHLNAVRAVLSKPPLIEVNTWSYAQSLETGKPLHSPPGRD